MSQDTSQDTDPIIPFGAVEEIEDRWPNGNKQSAFYSVHGEKIGYRYWDEDGSLSMEYGLKGDQRHGRFRTLYSEGKPSEEAFFIDGKEHGITRQYDYDGNLIGCYEMHYGTGADLWYWEKGVLSEERYYKDGQLDGYVRWWNWDNTTVWSEEHFNDGEYHGIFREWNDHNVLRRGSPKYFVNGQKVTKRQYLKACERDPSLPKFSAEDNLPYRKLPRDLMAQSAKLCPELDRQP